MPSGLTSALALMLNVDSDKIEQVISILGSESVDEEIEAIVIALVQDRMLARRLIDWPPEAFGLILVSHMAKVILPTTFSAQSKQGKWIEFDFKVEPIFEVALRSAMNMYHSGPRSTFSRLANRSSFVATASQALNKGASLDGATFSGPALIGVPAEIYLSQTKSLWQRLFQ